jgi:hypothetical protein
MFNLEQSISEWRKQMFAAGVKPSVLEELEAHLRDGFEQQVRLGLSRQEAFQFVVQEIGDMKQIKAEFMKLENWNRPLAWIAWSLFVVSFFLTAVNDTMGWQCAWLSASVVSWDWHDLSHGHLGQLSLASLTLANLLMMASPFLVAYSKNGSLKWPRWLFFSAGIWVWLYIVGLMAQGAFHQLKIGCYAWGLSFLFLWLSTVTVRSPKTLLLKNV